MNKISYQPIEWLSDRNQVRILDQTLLPAEETYIETDDYLEVAVAIKELKVRGAPAIGVAGAFGVAVGALSIESDDVDSFRTQLAAIVATINTTRPTARNLFWATERMEKAVNGGSIAEIKANLVAEANRIHTEEAEATEQLSKLGADLIPDGATILTHCNTGPLATTGYGTALGCIIYAHQQGKKVQVLADETRPLLQGARLTTWELMKAGIPVTLITDSMAGHFMKAGKIDCAIVGADRITANGDTANKIGTYTVAVMCKENGVPFYVAAPTTTIDATLATGDEIVIEERKREEVAGFRGVVTAPEGCPVANPAFDVTPNRYVTALITERGIIRDSFTEGIARVV